MEAINGSNVKIVKPKTHGAMEINPWEASRRMKGVIFFHRLNISELLWW
jgi:hypothetical protein